MYMIAFVRRYNTLKIVISLMTLVNIKSCTFYVIYFFMISLWNLSNLSIANISSQWRSGHENTFNGTRSFWTCQTQTFVPQKILPLRECSNEKLSIFWRNAIMKNWDFRKWISWKNFFFYFKRSLFLIFLKTWIPVFTFCFWLINLWRK